MIDAMNLIGIEKVLSKSNPGRDNLFARPRQHLPISQIRLYLPSFKIGLLHTKKNFK